HLAYTPEPAVDLDTGAVVAAETHPADEGDTTTLTGTLQAAETTLAGGRRLPKGGAERQELPLPRRFEGSRRRRVENAHCRAAAKGFLPLAR
ncbi:MAG TPA: hypothetical protein VLA17_15840, partial [Candidatus Limnocylindria bacterium]|nr:hypothetical protein [Candidatus Limnocylindria bacterium]